MLQYNGHTFNILWENIPGVSSTKQVAIKVYNTKSYKSISVTTDIQHYSCLELLSSEEKVQYLNYVLGINVADIT